MSQQCNCETYQIMDLQRETTSAKLQELLTKVERLRERWKYYDEPLTEHSLWEIAQEIEKLTRWAR